MKPINKELLKDVCREWLTGSLDSEEAMWIVTLLVNIQEPSHDALKWAKRAMAVITEN